MLLKICAAREESAVVDEAKAINDAKALYKAGEGKLGTDDEVFINLFGRCSWAHLKAVAAQYVLCLYHVVFLLFLLLPPPPPSHLTYVRRYSQTNKKHRTLDQAVDAEFSGAIFRSLRMILLYANFGRVEFYSDFVYLAMKVPLQKLIHFCRLEFLTCDRAWVRTTPTSGGRCCCSVSLRK